MVVAPSQGGCGPWAPNMGWKVRDIARCCATLWDTFRYLAINHEQKLPEASHSPMKVTSKTAADRQLRWSRRARQPRALTRAVTAEATVERQ